MKKLKQLMLSEKMPRKLKLFRERRIWDYYLAYFIYSHQIRRQPVDYCFMSYAGSGRTWVRYILGKYFEYTYKVPFTTPFKAPFTIRFDKRLSTEVPIIVFTHDTRHLKCHKNKKAVFLIRDPRDIVVSNYHRRKDRLGVFTGSVSEFIRSNDGIKSIIKDQNKLVEYQNYPSEVLWITYENLRNQTKKEMLKLLKFLGSEVNENNLARAIEFSEFGNLQKMERKGRFNPGRPQKFKKGDLNAFHVRKGEVGGYKEELSTVDIEYINKRISNRLKLDNYK